MRLLLCLWVVLTSVCKRDEKGVISAFFEFLTAWRSNFPKLNISKTFVYNFLPDSVNYGRSKRSGWPPNLPLLCKRNTVRRDVRDCAYSCSINSVLVLSVASRIVRNLFRKFQMLEIWYIESKVKTTKHHIDTRLKLASSNVLKCNQE